MSFNVEVQERAGGAWTPNGLFFGSVDQAKGYADDLFMRWMGIDATRVVEKEHEVSHIWYDRQLISLEVGDIELLKAAGRHFNSIGDRATVKAILAFMEDRIPLRETNPFIHDQFIAYCTELEQAS